LITTNEKKYVLRNPVKQNDKNSEPFEFKFLEYLKKMDFPYKTPLPIPTKDGRNFVLYNKRFFYLYEYIEGKLNLKPTANDLREVGKLIGILHDLVEASGLDNGVKRSSRESIKLIFDDLRLKREVALKKKNKYDDAFLKAEKGFQAIFRKLNLESFYRAKSYPVHWDITPSNLVWRGNKIVGVLDFENVGYEKAGLLTDLSASYYCCLVKKNYKLDLGLFAAMLEGYEKKRGLSDADISDLIKLIIVSHASDLGFLYWKLGEKNTPMKPSDLILDWKGGMWVYKNRKRILSYLLKHRAKEA
jgi:Ser/Thr protein kinase RdoA (MazF antagonist)